MMNHLYKDYLEGQFIPDVEVHKIDNGHFKASSMGLEFTHWDQCEAVNRLTDMIREGLEKGELHPFMNE